MHFGIMAMQLNSFIPGDRTPAQVMASLASFDHAQLVEKLNAHGFDPIELGGDLGMFIPQSFAPPAIERLAALKKTLGIHFTVHLPLWSVEPSTPLESVRQGSIRAIVDCIRATQSLAPQVYVLHATGALAAEFYHMGLPDVARSLLLRQFQDRARASIQTILAESGLASRGLAVETIDFPLELTLAIADEFDLSICLDTGHVLSGFPGDHDLFDVLEQVLPRLAEIHLHDAPRHVKGTEIEHGSDHQRLGAGDLDVERFLNRLMSVGFDGPIVMELTVPQALASLQVIRELCPNLT